MTADELRVELLDHVCRCGQPKTSGHSLCRSCWDRLPGRLGIRLYRKIGAGYEEAYAEAATWLDTLRDTGEAPPEPKEPRPPYIFTIPLGTGLSHCRGCGGGIYWIRTSRGKNMPVNQDGTSHFTSCEKASDFRKKK